ncbi:hypothetical protein C0J52_19552 [Blattella germanica]|nr:hypothetical protein C0J52_19552 [Blattella germanica]
MYKHRKGKPLTSDEKIIVIVLNVFYKLAENYPEVAINDITGMTSGLTGVSLSAIFKARKDLKCYVLIMEQRRKQPVLHKQARELIYKVNAYFKKEASAVEDNGGPACSVVKCAKQTAEACGVAMHNGPEFQSDWKKLRAVIPRENNELQMDAILLLRFNNAEGHHFALQLSLFV